MNFLFLFFNQSTALSSHAADGHQTYFVGSAVDKASTIGIGISPRPPLIFTGGSKSWNLASFKHHSNLSRMHLKCSKISEIWNKSAMPRWSPYVRASFGDWVHAPLRKLCQFCPPPKIARKIALNRQKLSSRLFDSAQILYRI